MNQSENNTRPRVRSHRQLGRKSSKRVQTGEPLRIGVSNHYFAGDLNATLELVVHLRQTSGWPTNRELGPFAVRQDLSVHRQVTELSFPGTVTLRNWTRRDTLALIRNIIIPAHSVRPNFPGGSYAANSERYDDCSWHRPDVRSGCGSPALDSLYRNSEAR